MKEIALEQLCLQCCEIIGNTAGWIKAELGQVSNNQIEVKSLNSLVSYVDKTAEQQLVASLRKLLPSSTFLTEEETVASQKGKYQWIIDPLDGTTNFLHQIPCFAISVALRHHETTVIGIVHEINRGESFYGWLHGGAFLNGTPIRVSSSTNLQNTLIATGFPYRDFSRVDAYLEVLKHLMQHSRGIRRLGAAAVDLAYVACGRFDAFFEYGLSPWDVAAGAFLVQQAGGMVSDFKNGPDYVFGEQILATNKDIYAAMCEVVAHLRD